MNTQINAEFQNPKVAFKSGTVIPLKEVTVSKEEIIEFATEFDPAYFHIDEQAAEQSMLGGLVASGFHTCAISMRMICDTYLTASTSQGAPEVEEINWHSPVRPGDVLSGVTHVLDGRQSSSKPDLWVSRLRHELTNQKDETVMTMVVVALFRIMEKDL